MRVAIAQWYKPTDGGHPEEIASTYVRFASDLIGHRE
jgi:hypothetical protein